MIDEFPREVYVADGNIFAIHELFEVVADETLHFLGGHTGVGHASLLFIERRCRGLLLDSKNRGLGEMLRPGAEVAQ
jgi:hypothetical protein